MSLRLYLHIYQVFICVFIYLFYNNTLTIENYAGISHPHDIHGNASVVAVVLLRHVEKDER